MSKTDVIRSNRKVRTHAILTAAVGLGLVVALGLSWQLYTYQGFVASIAEWQFRVIGRLYPLATIVSLTLLVILPLLLLLAVRSRRQRVGTLLASEPQAVIKRARLAMRDLLFVAALAGLAGLGLWIYANTIGQNAAIYVLRAGQPVPPLNIGDRVKVAGNFRLDQLAIYQNDTPFFANAMAVAPVEIEREKPPFILAEVQQDKAGPSVLTSLDGFVAGPGVARPLLPLFRNAGVPISAEPVILMRSLESLRTPFKHASAVLFLLSLAIALFGFAERYWLSILERQFGREKEVKIG